MRLQLNTLPSGPLRTGRAVTARRWRIGMHQVIGILLDPTGQADVAREVEDRRGDLQPGEGEVRLVKTK